MREIIITFLAIIINITLFSLILAFLLGALVLIIKFLFWLLFLGVKL